MIGLVKYDLNKTEDFLHIKNEVFRLMQNAMNYRTIPSGDDRLLALTEGSSAIC